MRGERRSLGICGVLRSRWLRCGVLVLCATGPASAQEELELVVVTGSRIARPDFESASPIVSVTADLFERTASGTVESSLNTLPQFVPAFTASSNNPGNNGQANVSLRGLGTTSTLVLVDGRRLMPANGTGVADLNIIPSSLISSVEIITGGASAVYGSDALAGVVNFKLKHDFDGIEFDGSWGQTDRGDGTQYEAGVTAGTNFASGRGTLMAQVGYAERGLVTYRHRDFSKYALVYAGGPGDGTLGPGSSFLPTGNSSIEEGRVLLNGPGRPSEQAFDDLMVSYGYASGEVPFTGPAAFPGGPPLTNTQFGFNADGTLFTTGNGVFQQAQFSAVRNFRGERDPITINDYFYTYNFAPDNALQLPLNRASAYLRAGFDVSDSLRFEVQALYADYSATQQLAPVPVRGLFIPADNPYVPADLKSLLDSRPVDPAAPFTLEKRLSETGPRRAEYRNEVYQSTFGVSGDFGNGWSYEGYVQIGGNEQEDFQDGNVLTSRMEELTYAADGGVSICGGFNPFGKGSISAECLDYIQVDASNTAAVHQKIAEISATGPLMALPAGKAIAVVGVFYKEDEYRYAASPEASVFLGPPGVPCTPDVFCRPDIQGFNASQDIRGSDSNFDAYTELLVPLLGDAPGVQSLEAVFGYRSSDYESAGRFDAWKAELLYQPVDSLRIRASYQQAIRAPSVFELYLPQLPTDFFISDNGFVDPCTAGSPERGGADGARVEALCLAQGMPAAVLPDFSDSDDLAPGVAGGNPELGQEEASTSTLGVVWTSTSNRPALAQLQFSLDWYRIDIDDKIDTVLFSQFVPYCYDARYNPDFSTSNQWCSLFSRDATSGEMTGVHEIYNNGYDLKTRGLDAQLDWGLDAGAGRFGVNLLVSWLDSFETSVTRSTAPATERAGTLGRDVGGSLPEWKSNLRVSYGWRELTIGAGWRNVGAMRDREVAFHVPSVDYFDLNAQYTIREGFLDGLEFGIGIENVTDEDPPIYPSYVQANTDPSQYDPFGRRYYATLRYAF